ncbi:ATP-binding protein [Anaerosacchariphilus polymeriproducens]|uniref:ATP-binding protein n=1 Tax=Anaerosacchariphilus polymeriproducens TaxID=1812858 RepID=A0A371AUX7_9FIRM|nr:ATP-binding protein [Anaerosacchariphilus polymeriproducens]RDU23280.1 ATP-binding protein [Anaerosacchariphilus polymeriproducens]
MVGRNTERKFLEECFKKDGNQLVVVYGRKEVGKTTLIKEFCEDKKFVYYQSRQASELQQKKMFAEEIEQQFKISLKEKTFDLIFSRIRSGDASRLVLIVDEFHFIVKKDKSFVDSLVKLLNKQLYPGPVMVILISSSISWIEQEMVSCLRNCASRINLLKVKEFGFIDTVKSFKEYSVIECIITYGILGGVPGYMKHWNSGFSIKENVCNLILNNRGPLYGEAESYIAQELREISIYNTILYTIASGKIKLNDIYKYTGFSRAKISVYMKNLMQFEVIEKIYSYQTKGKEHTMKGVYQIKNPFINFWYRFIYPHLSARELLMPEEFYERFIEPYLMEYTERYFVQVCSEYLKLVNQIGKLPIKIEKMGSWVGKEGTIHIIAQDKDGHSLIGQCNLLELEMTYDMCEHLFYCMDKAKISADYYYLFSAKFDTKLKKVAKADSRIVLINMNQL